MTLSLIPKEEMREKVGKEKIKRYRKYRNFVQTNAPWIKEEIKKNNNESISIKVSNIKNELEIENRTDYAIFWALRYLLYFEGIIVKMRKHIDGGHLLIMRMGNEDDQLPKSLWRLALEELDEEENGKE